MIDITAMIHRCAAVHPNVIIGRRTRVWQFASVIRGAKIGADGTIASGAIVDAARIGDRCLISHGAFIGPGMRLGDDVFVGPQASLCNDLWPRTDKAGWFSMAELLSGDVTVTRIEDGASIGANAVVLPGVSIGAGAMIAAGAVVDRNVPALCLFRRDGQMLPIDPARTPDRRRAVACA